MRRWATSAAACGWSTLDIFGVHETRPDVRFDAMGLVMLTRRARINGIDRDGADLLIGAGIELRFRRRPFPPETVPLWEWIDRQSHARR